MLRRSEQSGFTLAETMVSMLILSLVGVIIVGGIAMATRVYSRIVEKANAELLLSTTLLEMRNELDRVEEIQISDSDVEGEYVLVQYRASNASWKRLGSDADDGVFALVGSGYDWNEDSATKEILVTNEAATEGLRAAFDAISVVGDGIESNKQSETTPIFVVRGLRVVNKSNTTLASASDVDIRTVHAVRVKW